MNDYEILLDDLLTQKSKLELERAYRIRKEDIIEFIGYVVNGDPNDKEYQRSVIENLISLVIYADDDTIVTFTSEVAICLMVRLLQKPKYKEQQVSQN